MLQENVTAKSLTCILNRDITIEPIPEPFRMQSEISFHVTYSEYINYILSLPQDTPVVLCKPVTLLKQLSNTSKYKLYGYYLQDIAFAICKEVYYAERHSKDASVILPASYNSSRLTVADYVQNYELCRSVENELFTEVHAAGIIIPKVKRERNLTLLKLAVCLYYVSKAQGKVKEVNLVYNM